MIYLQFLDFLFLSYIS